MVNEKHSVALSSVFASFFLTGFKLIVGLFTGSLGILSEALHSTLDMVAAVITYISVKKSDKPADKCHHYGHGKIENLSALIETVLLLLTCIWVIYEAYNRLSTGNTHIEYSIWSYIVVISSIVIDYNRSRKLKKAAKKHNSQALEADALHFSTDILSSFVVLIGLILSNFGIYWADSVSAIGVSLIILIVSYRLGKSAIGVLLDKAPVDITEKVKKFLNENSKNYHSLKIRTSGADTFIKFNLHVDHKMSITNAHRLCDNLERGIHHIIPRSEIYIHIEPNTLEHKNNEINDGL